MVRIVGDPVLHVAAALHARERRSERRQALFGEMNGELVLVEEIGRRAAPAPVEMNLATGIIGAHEAGERADAGARPDEDQRRPALDGSKRGILTDEGVDPASRLKTMQEAGAGSVLLQPHAD